MLRCRQCQGFVPAPLESCPNCQTQTCSSSSNVMRTLGTLVGASVVSLTLMACYGSPPDFHNRPGNPGDDNPLTDSTDNNDSDGKDGKPGKPPHNNGPSD